MVIWPQSNGEPLIEFNPCHDPASGKFCSNPMERPGFAEWFGNSKVVDAKGSPLRVYHGTKTPTRFDTFAPAGKWQNTEGVWFTDSPEYAGNYTQEFVKKRFTFARDSRLIPAYLRIERPKRPADLGEFVALNWTTLRAEGYDGIIYREANKKTNNATTYVVFTASQVKSAFNATFDRTSDKFTEFCSTKGGGGSGSGGGG